METKFDVGEEVYFKATIKSIEVYPNGKIAYKIKEWPDFLFAEDELLESGEPLQHIANTLERIEKKIPITSCAQIPVLIGKEKVDEISLRNIH